MDIDVAHDALLSDAQAWDQAATGLGGPKGAVAPLQLNGAADVMGKGSELGLDDTYNEIRRLTESMLEQGSAYFTDLAETLRAVSADYAAEDEDAANYLRAQMSDVPPSRTYCRHFRWGISVRRNYYQRSSRYSRTDSRQNSRNIRQGR